MNSRALIIGGLTLAVVGSWLLRLGGHQSATADERVAGTKLLSVQDSFSQKKLSLPPTRISDREPTASARAMYVVDVASGYPLYEHNAGTAVPIASTTKMMTAIIATENFELDDVVTVSQNAASAIGSDVQLVAGETITVDALLKALLIQSGNDSAMALAEHMGLSTFVEKMNAKAAELGLQDTAFKDPAGLDDTGHSSARDLGVIAAYALRNEVIQGIARITEATIESTDLRYSHQLETSNRLIKPDHPLFMPDATGLKTGFTPDAGHCLVASANRDGHELIVVVLGTTESTVEASAKESKKLLDWAYSAYQWEGRAN